MSLEWNNPYTGHVRAKLGWCIGYIIGCQCNVQREIKEKEKMHTLYRCIRIDTILYAPHVYTATVRSQIYQSTCNARLTQLLSEQDLEESWQLELCVWSSCGSNIKFVSKNYPIQCRLIVGCDSNWIFDIVGILTAIIPSCESDTKNKIKKMKKTRIKIGERNFCMLVYHLMTLHSVHISLQANSNLFCVFDLYSLVILTQSTSFERLH